MAILANGARKTRKYAESAGEDLYHQIEGALGYLNELSDSLSRRSRSQMSRAQDYASDAAHDAEDTIRGNLTVSLLVALGLGVMIGFLLPRR